MKRVFALAAFAIVASFALGTGTAQAAGAPCVTNAEYSNVRLGMKMQRVQTILDSNGKTTFHYSSAGYRYVSKEWKRCGMDNWHLVWVDFVNGRVDSKGRF